jgi:hypothetical protein
VSGVVTGVAGTIGCGTFGVTGAINVFIIFIIDEIPLDETSADVVATIVAAAGIVPSDVPALAPFGVLTPSVVVIMDAATSLDDFGKIIVDGTGSGAGAGAR